MAGRRDLILATVRDLIEKLLNSDRKEDEELPRGEIEEAIDEKEISVEEIIEEFGQTLREALES